MSEHAGMALECSHCGGDASPSALKWIQRFMAHCAIYGYAEQVKKCQLRLDWISAKGAP